MAKFSNVRDDFLGAAVDASTFRILSEVTWGYSGTSATTPTTSGLTPTATTPGVVRLTASSVSTRDMFLTSAINTLRFGDARILRFRATMGSTSSVIIRLGDPTGGLYLQYSSAVGATWHAIATVGGTTDTDLGVVATTSPITWELVRVNTSLWHVFSVTSAGRAFNASLTANLPTAATGLAPLFYVESLSGVKTLDVDLFEFTSVEFANR